MRASLKINFTDFWPGFIKSDNYFYNLLSQHYEVSIADEPDILFYSCYGKDYLQFYCVRIFFSAENMRPDFSGCDYAMTFDYLQNQKHYRLPLYGLYIEQRGNLNELLRVNTKEQALAAWAKKTKFCCMVVSNGISKKRIDFFHELSKVKQVDSGGKYLNNIGGPVKDKLSFISDYKFVIAFENSSYPGYTTEKILDPLYVQSIPVYWGNSLVGNDFNKKKFLDYADYTDANELIEAMLEIEKNPELAINMLMEPVFPNNFVPEYINDRNVFLFLEHIIKNKKTVKPVAQTSKSIIHSLNRRKRVLQYYIEKMLNKNFR
ncbi:MAG: glycosyltransferase [Bacteroidetes bacterium]|nr:glycosyltransferase [Bacteroidota bacterium]